MRLTKFLHHAWVQPLSVSLTYLSFNNALALMPKLSWKNTQGIPLYVEASYCSVPFYELAYGKSAGMGYCYMTRLRKQTLMLYHYKPPPMRVQRLILKSAFPKSAQTWWTCIVKRKPYAYHLIGLMIVLLISCQIPHYHKANSTHTLWRNISQGNSNKDTSTSTIHFNCICKLHLCGEKGWRLTSMYILLWVKQNYHQVPIHITTNAKCPRRAKVSYHLY